MSLRYYGSGVRVVAVAISLWLACVTGARAERSHDLDLALTIAGTALTAGGLIGVSHVAPVNETELQSLDVAVLPPIDRQLLAAPNSALGHVSTMLAYGQVALPLFVVGSRTEGGEAWLLLWRYYQVLSIAHGTKDLVKTAVRRARPYLYQSGAPVPAADDHSSAGSFPSGHATLAFASAVFLTTVASERWGREATVLIGTGSLALATTASALRVAAGQHFVTDVIAGAVFGGLVGWLVPLLHRSSGSATLRNNPSVPRSGPVTFDFGPSSNSGVAARLAVAW